MLNREYMILQLLVNTEIAADQLESKSDIELKHLYDKHAKEVK